MRTLMIILLAFILPDSLYSQDLMTIGEVFNFEIGDEFHYEGHHPEQPPNADRITITDKYYSSNGDTLFYHKYHDSYYTWVEWEPEPHLEYYFWTRTDTVYYTHPDSSISSYNMWASNDTSLAYYETIVYYSEDQCDSLINGYYLETSNFEADVYHYEFGKGLGLVKAYYLSSQNWPHFVVYDDELFYYQKNGIDCGVPDTLTVSIPQLSENYPDFNIYPNPAENQITIEITQLSFNSLTLEIIDELGRTVKTSIIHDNETTINIDDLRPGIYYCKVSGDRIFNVERFIKH